jgi:hypothetical protein
MFENAESGFRNGDNHEKSSVLNADPSVGVSACGAAGLGDGAAAIQNA